MTNPQTLDEASAELARELDTLKDSEVPPLVKRLAELKAARYLIPTTGETMTAEQHKRESEYCRDMLVNHLNRIGETTLHVEGLPLLRLQPRRTVTYDATHISEADWQLFRRLIEVRGLLVNNAVANAQMKAGNLTGLKGYAMTGETQALVFERER